MIDAFADQYEKLIAPTFSGMDRVIFESISADIHVKLFYGNDIVYDGVFISCGMEVSDIKDMAN